MTNTLVVAERPGFLPGEEAYLSGEPLHVLALRLGLKLREELGAAFPISFSAGVDAANVAGVVACGFVPVTSCTDLLRPGGYQRLHRQAEALAAAMGDAGAATLSRLRPGAGGIAGGDLAEASLANHRRAAAEALGDARYAARAHRKAAAEDRVAPPPLGLHQLRQVHPRLPERRELRVRDPAADDRRTAISSSATGGSFRRRRTDARDGRRKASPHQIANWADACNDCGNCDVFCPEDGGPYIEKPRLFSSLASFLADAPRPGFFVRRDRRRLARRPGGAGEAATWSCVVAPGGSALFRDGVAELRFASAGGRGARGGAPPRPARARRARRARGPLPLPARPRGRALRAGRRLVADRDVSGHVRSEIST